MRKGVALLLAVLLLTLTVPAGAANGAELTVGSWTLTGQEESITLEVTLTGGGDSYGGGFILWYDSLCLELINLESGSALDGAMVAANPELGDGVARMSWVSLNPLAGDGVAARATFRVLSQESSQVELLNAELLDGAGNSLPLQPPRTIHTDSANNHTPILDFTAFPPPLPCLSFHFAFFFLFSPPSFWKINVKSILNFQI